MSWSEVFDDASASQRSAEMRSFATQATPFTRHNGGDWLLRRRGEYVFGKHRTGVRMLGVNPRRTATCASYLRRRTFGEACENSGLQLAPHVLRLWQSHSRRRRRRSIRTFGGPKILWVSQKTKSCREAFPNDPANGASVPRQLQQRCAIQSRGG
jgi:hypothetical protein